MNTQHGEPAGPIAVDAMGGDRAPDEIVSGAVRAATELGVEVLLVGREDEIGKVLPDAVPDTVTVRHAPDVIGMDDPATSVRSRKDSSVVQCAEAVSSGDASAMISAGNTGAAMASALLRFGRIKGVARPAIALPIPAPGRPPQIMVDGGATVDCQAEWLRQFAVLGREYSRIRCEVAQPRVALLSNGEEPGKGDALRKEAVALLADVDGFVGNCEGRDLLGPDYDVIVTDGFTGNVALKTLEGALRTFSALVLSVLDSSDETRRASEAVLPPLLDAASVFDPDQTGGAMLLGVRGVCVISHGSSSDTAIVNGIRAAADAVRRGTIERLEAAVERAG